MFFFRSADILGVYVQNQDSLPLQEIFLQGIAFFYALSPGPSPRPLDFFFYTHWYLKESKFINQLLILFSSTLFFGTTRILLYRSAAIRFAPRYGGILPENTNAFEYLLRRFIGVCYQKLIICFKSRVYYPLNY